MASHIERRKFLATLGGAAAAWPLAARAEQPAMPVIAFINGASAVASAHYAPALRNGLNETGYIEGQNVTVEYHWLDGQYNRLPALMADLVRRQVAVIAPTGNLPRWPPKLQPRRSRSSSASRKTRLNLALSPASRGRAATRPASIFFSPRRWRSDWGCCVIWCPQPLALP